MQLLSPNNLMADTRLSDKLYIRKSTFWDFNGWRRVWLILSIQAFPCIYVIALFSDASYEQISNGGFAIFALVLSALFSSTLYATGLAFSMIRTELKYRSIPIGYKRFAWIPVLFLALITLYYIFSPYQKCYRAVSETSSERAATLQCLRMTSW